MLLPQEWNRYLVSQDEMARSYHLTGDLNRSWMKKFIAYLCSFYGIDSRLETIESVVHKASFTHIRKTQPVPLAAVFAYTNQGEWNRLLAAAIPAITAGTEETAVFLIKQGQQEPSPDILTSLELAGIENIYLVEISQAESAAEVLAETGKAALMNLCQDNKADGMDRKLSSNPKYLKLSSQPDMRALIWADGINVWNYEIISWANPSMQCTVAGPEADKAPDNFVRTDAPLQELLEQPFDVFFGPDDIFKSCNIPRGFSQDMEPFWIWTELNTGFFKQNRVYWKEITRV